MKSLAAKRILVVEDEAIVAMMIEDMLLELGAVPVGPAASLKAALELAEGGVFDAAILDVNLSGEHTSDVAALLRARAIPYVFATGYGAVGAETFGHSAVLQKPFRISEMESALLSALPQ